MEHQRSMKWLLGARKDIKGMHKEIRDEQLTVSYQIEEKRKLNS